MRKMYHLMRCARPGIKFFGLTLLALLLTGNAPLSAQADHSVTGTVLDPGGEPVIGANVRVKGTEVGAVTDFDGIYTIQADSEDVLVISYIGFETIELEVGDRSIVDATLRPSAETLDEIVVVGYGSARKSDLTGAVSSVTGESLRNSVTANIDQALQGRVAGVQITQNSGQPGGVSSIRIRGTNSITGSSEPLYVIDGIPFQGDGQEVAGFDWAGGANGQEKVNPLSTISPQDIVRIEVLKDASASAIYGARGANGVILITTRRGEKGESKISYNGYVATQSVPTTMPMMTLPQFADYQVNVTQDLGLRTNQRYLDQSILGQGTDWQDAIFRDAAMHSHQLSISGGNDKTTYAISGGYFFQDGIIIGSGFDRLTTRINLDNQVKDWIKVGGSLAYADTDETITLNDGGDGVIMQALLMQPDVPVIDLNGNYAGPDISAGGTSYNPVAAALQRNNTVDRQRLMANAYADATILEGLTFRSEIGFDDNHSLNVAFHPTYKWGILENNENQLRQREESSFFWIWKNYLTYNLDFGSTHSLTALLGQEAQKSRWQGAQVTKKNFSSNDIHVLSEGDDATSSTNGWKDSQTLASYFGRLNYSFDERFLVTFTLRADGSSKFGPENKWGYFPSGSVAWRIGNEPFFENDLVSGAKLRLGYGVVGNQAIGNYLYGSSLLTVNSPFGTAYRLEKISNPNLKWESTEQINLGADLSFVQGRVDFSFDIYKKQTRDMLLLLSIPSYLGGTNYNDIKAPYANVGKMENKGFEFSITTRNIRKPNVTWDTDLTFSLNRNEVTELDDETRSYSRNLYWYSEFQTAAITRVGYPVGQFYGYIMEGLFTDQDDILGHAVQIVDPATVSSDNPNGLNLADKQQGVWIGDIKFRDLNGDGVVNTNDQTFIGDPNPDFTFGINNSLSFGPVDFVVYLFGSVGGDILNYSRVLMEGQTSVYNNQAATVDDRARIGLYDPAGSTTDPANVYLINPDTDIPRPTTTDNNRNNRMSDRYIEDGTYLRIQNIRVGYTLPARLTEKARISKLRLYVNAQNIHTFTKYSGYDPEIGAFNQDPLLQNADMGRYPTPRVITLGLDVDF